MKRMIVYPPCTETPARSARPSSSIGSRSPPTCGCICPIQHIKGLDFSREMEVSQFPGGHSNLTYLVRFGGAEMVMRRPPLGPVPPKAHDMAREYRWLAALHPVFPLAPRPYLLCEDADGHRLGLLRHGTPPRRRRAQRGAARPARITRRHGGGSARRSVDTLADLHALDVTRRSARRARQADGLRRAPGARLERAVEGVEARRPPRDGCARRLADRAHCRRTPIRRQSCTATSSSITCCSIRSTSGIWSRSSTGR